MRHQRPSPILPSRLPWALLLCAAACLAGRADAALPIPDQQAHGVEGPSRIHDMYTEGLYWIDANTLAMTARVDPKDLPYGARRLLVVDAGTGKVLLTKDNAFPVCANPAQGFFRYVEGDPLDTRGKFYKGKQVWHTVRWRQGALVEVDVKGLASMGCVATDPNDSGDDALQGIGQVRYFNDGQGKLRRGYENQSGPDSVEWVNGQAVRPVGLTQSEVYEGFPFRSAAVDYLAFDRDYLVRPGLFAKDSVDPPLPLVRLGRDGKVRRQPFPKAADGLLATRQSGFSVVMHPMAGGHLITVEASAADGGGLYKSQGASLKRIWCTAAQDRSRPDAKTCIPSAIQVSPDGCKVAFTTPHAAASDEDAWMSEPTGTVRLQVLSLCAASPRR